MGAQPAPAAAVSWHTDAGLSELKSLLFEISGCQLCKAALPFQPKPVLQCSGEASILLAGQAPGYRAHASGIAFDDASGERLRGWMGIGRNEFYDPAMTAILPLGFCYPGRGQSGDLPPRPECAATWRQPLLEQLPNIELTLVLGAYAQRYHLNSRATSVTERVRAWRDYWPDVVPLPHPSPRNNRWLKQNPWFSEELLPALRRRIKQILERSKNE